MKQWKIFEFTIDTTIWLIFPAIAISKEAIGVVWLCFGLGIFFNRGE